MSHFPLLSPTALTTFSEDIYYCTMAELRDACDRLGLSHLGIKVMLINRIIAFITTGKKIAHPAIPPQSKAQRGKIYPLHPSTLMLHGSYKNDARTREFFKELIGRHFHFTAFGIDWLNDHWYKGNPPTYAEFAQFWQEEYERRKDLPQTILKREWAFLNFMRECKENNPHITNQEALAQWEALRQHKATDVLKTLMRIITQMNISGSNSPH